MRETLRDWQSRFGSGRAIAAPQIGAPVRMVAWIAPELEAAAATDEADDEEDAP